MDKILDSILEANRGSLAKAITLIENESEGSFELLRRLEGHTGKAHVIGITGPPGAGKSTFINALTKEFLNTYEKIGIIAVDPSSPFTGGAVLGDRIRMKSHTLNDRVFMRSMGSRGNLGGLSSKTRQAAQLMDAFGMDKVIIETVGVGQSEVEIAQNADTVIVLLAPGFGDDIQALKAGILEIADIFIVNKSDNPLSAKLVRELEYAVMMGHNMDWTAPIIKCSSEIGEGIEEAYSAIESHMQYLKNTPAGIAKTKNALSRRLLTLTEERIKKAVNQRVDELGGLNYLISDMQQKGLTIFDVSERLFNELFN